MFKKINNVTGEDKLSSQHKGVLVSDAWENTVSYHGADMS